MRFSDAIREGAKKKPQKFAGGFDGESTCAMAAALDAFGIETDMTIQTSVNLWPELHGYDACCPQCVVASVNSRWSIITLHLNDHHRWTREAIADWYEQNFEQTDESLITATVAEAKKHAAEPELVEA